MKKKLVGIAGSGKAAVKKSPMQRDQHLVSAVGPAKPRVSRQGKGYARWHPLALAVLHTIDLNRDPKKPISKYFRPAFPEFIADKEARQEPVVTDGAINQRPWRALEYREINNFKHLLDEARELVRERCGL